MLNKFFKIAMATTALMALSGVANAEGTQTYVSGSAGISFSDTESFDSVRSEEDAGYDISVAVGYKFDSLRAELEAEYLSSRLADSDIDHNALALMFNGFYDVKNSSKFTPYFGAGVGLAQTSFTVDGDGMDDTVFAYQAMAGVSYEIDGHNSVSLGYRYFGTQDSEYRGAKASFDKHVTEVGYRYTF